MKLFNSYNILVSSPILIIVVLISFIGFGWFNHRNKLEQAKLKSLIDGYVDCMVDTYFYGYLKKIIPNDEGKEGLYHKIMNYKEKENLTNEEFPFHKIFIVICSSGYVPPTLDDIDKQRIEPRKNLEKIILNHAGTSGRVYSTSVYKVKYRDLINHITVAMEGAPPLLILRDSCKENAELKKHKDKIIYMFYEKLSQKLKENEEFANSYELLFYKDDPERPTLADVIIHRHIDRGYPSVPSLKDQSIGVS